MKQKDVIISSSILRQDFSYSKKGVSLKFSLRVDNSSELRPFKDCMKQGIIDIEKILKGMKN